MAVGSAVRALARRPVGPSLWTWLAVGIATVLAVPIAAVVSSLAAPAGDVWLHLWRTQLLELVSQTLLLLVSASASARWWSGAGSPGSSCTTASPGAACSNGR